MFPVRMPSGERYWTLLNDDLELVVAADEFLDMRFGRDAAESTTRTYAGGIALFLQRCALTGRDWRTAAGYLGMFMLWLRHAETGGDVVLTGPGTKAVRGPANPMTGEVRLGPLLAADDGGGRASATSRESIGLSQRVGPHHPRSSTPGLTRDKRGCGRATSCPRTL